VGELIHEDLVTGVDCSLRNCLTLGVVVAGKDLEVLAKGVGRRIDEEILPLTDHPGKGKKEGKLFQKNLGDLIVFSGNDIDVVASQDNELSDLAEDVRRRLGWRQRVIMPFKVGCIDPVG